MVHLISFIYALFLQFSLCSWCLRIFGFGTTPWDARPWDGSTDEKELEYVMSMVGIKEVLKRNVVMMGVSCGCIEWCFDCVQFPFDVHANMSVEAFHYGASN